MEQRRASEHACLSHVLLGTSWPYSVDPCGLQGRSVGIRGHVYYGIFVFYCFAEAKAAVHADEDDKLVLISCHSVPDDDVCMQTCMPEA